MNSYVNNSYYVIIFVKEMKITMLSGLHIYYHILSPSVI